MIATFMPNCPLIAARVGLFFPMNTSRPPYAKILVHADGLGVPSPELVRRRALELARIDGRSDYNELDWQHAKQELHGGHQATWDDEEDRMPQSISGRDMTATDSGHHVENLFGGEDNMSEELVAEGMDEAVHDQMLQASQLEEREEDTEEEEP
jgi:hypothetical protein